MCYVRRFQLGALLAGASLMSVVAAANANASTVVSDYPSADRADGAARSSGRAADEIIVTAQRRSESVQDVPVTVNAFDAALVEERRIIDLTDLATQAPGLRFSEFANAGNISIRGIGTAFVSGNGESSVGIYIDGVAVPQTKAFGLGQFDIGAVEVLRGPQGTLYGRNSTAGVINFTSAAPTKELSSGFTVGTGNYDSVRANAFVSAPIDDKLRMRLFIEREYRDGYVRNVFTGQDLNDLQAFGGRFSIDAEPLQGWSVKARLSHREERSAGPAFDSFDPSFPILSAFGLPVAFLQPDFDPYRVNSPTRYSGYRRLRVGSVTNTIDIADGLVLKSITGFTNARFNNTYDTLGTLLAYPISALAKSKTFSQELSLNGTSSKIDWVLGAYYFRQRYTLDNTSSPPPALGPTSRNDQAALQESASAFGDVTVLLGARTHLFGGLRFSRETVNQRLRIFDQTPAGEVLRCPGAGIDPEQKVRDDHVTGRLGIRQEVSDDVNVYVQGAHGYKGPSFSQSQCQNGYAPETVNSLEAGLKSRFWDRRLTLNISIFYNDIKDLQLEIVSPLGIVVDNVPKARIYGAEVALNVRPVDALRFDANVSLLNARYNSDYLGDANLSPNLTPQNVRGNRLNNAPDLSGLVGAEYDLNLGQDAGLLTFRGELNFTSQYNLREVSYPWTVQEGYTTQNAFITYRTADERLTLRGWVKNIGNKAILGGVLGFGGALGSFLPPRTYGVELIGKF
ncbi:TonB-dependent receptor [Novosphingobium sp. HII-3]|uniref:TonB-dependent receptor n=1 Tax=Novosphingobium sp. HII-3 TaxID=2075565 RepID=UPI000CDA6467|nr:TonB-dependent receptor plug domain-containing protein [Novosphingobium sp. HII-3]